MSDSPVILCLETSSSRCSVALYKEGICHHLADEKTQNHAEVLMDMIQSVCQKAQIALKDLSAIAISGGPGSYTGLRIGSSTAKGLCFALDIPLIAISTLEALASQAVAISDAEIVWPMIDARRMEVYHGLYDRSLNLLQPVTNAIVTEEDFKPDLTVGKKLVLCGDGAAKASEYLGLTDLNIQTDASFLCNLAVKAFNNREFVDLGAYEPFYLKSANITTSKKTVL